MEFCYWRRKRVSKHFLINGEDNPHWTYSPSQLDLLIIRMGLFSKEPQVPTADSSPPLIIAYTVYVGALIRQGFPRKRRAFEAESDGDIAHPIALIALDAMAETWLELALAQTVNVRPRQAGYTLQEAVYLARDSYLHGAYRSAILS
jgi:hypothetical protein